MNACICGGAAAVGFWDFVVSGKTDDDRRGGLLFVCPSIQSRGDAREARFPAAFIVP